MNGKSDLTMLSDAACIMMHATLEDYIDGKFDEHSHAAQKNIEQYAQYHEIPYVCFSGEHAQIGTFDGCAINLLSVKKSAFYARLKDFIEKYRTESVIELKILAYGKDYSRNVISEQLIKPLFHRLRVKNPSDRVELLDIEPADYTERDYLKEIVELAQPALGIGYEDLKKSIIEGMTIAEFTKRINNIKKSIIRYGRNTYTWE
jgi:hypothetical protein